MPERFSHSKATPGGRMTFQRVEHKVTTQETKLPAKKVSRREKDYTSRSPLKPASPCSNPGGFKIV